jgi:nucleoside-diphosphate-sugar epimerase
VKRFIHLSTTDVYGFPDRPVDETAPYRYRGWPYGDTKIDGEKMVWSEARGSGLPVTVIRPANVYGIGSESFVGEMADLIRGHSMFRIGRRPAPAGLCHVDNLVRCIIRAAESENAIGQAFNVTDGNGMSWATFADQLADAIGEPRPHLTLPRQAAYALGWMFEQVRKTSHSKGRPILTRMAVEILGTDQSFDITKARRRLAYDPVGSASDHMPGLARWLKEERS